MNEHNLPIENLRGQSYDGASNMSGKYKGVKTLLQKQQPLTYYTHCGAHRGSLIDQAVGTSVGIKDELTLINEIGLIFSGIIIFRHIHSQNSNEKIRPLCPTRWTIIKYTIFKVLNNYNDIIKSLEEFGIIERVVKCYMNVNTTLENTYKITEICLAELKSQRDDLGDKLNSIKVKIQCLDIKPLTMKRKRKMPERYIGVYLMYLLIIYL